MFNDERLTEWGGLKVNETISGVVSGTLSGENSMMNLIIAGIAEWPASGRYFRKATKFAKENKFHRAFVRGNPVAYPHISNFLKKNPKKDIEDYVSLIDKSIRSKHNWFSNRFGAGKKARSDAILKAFGKKGASALYKGLKVKNLGRMIGFAPFIMMGIEAVSSAVSVPVQLQTPPSSYSSGFGGTFYDTSVAYTQRQRALRMIHDSQYSGRAAFGNESSFLHS